LLLEVDEQNGHLYNDPRCELARHILLQDQRPSLPLWIVRYNPQWAFCPDKLMYLAEALREGLSATPEILAAAEDSITVRYLGYPKKRLQVLEDTKQDMEDEIMAMAYGRGTSCPIVIDD
jgi:hypothetical protein